MTRGVDDGEVRRRVVAVLEEESVAVELRASGSRGSTRGTPAKKLRGSGRPEHQWRREISMAKVLTGGGSQGDSGAAEVGAEGSGLGEAPGVKAKPRRCFVGAGRGWRNGSTAVRWSSELRSEWGRWR